jgi:hypothetical protein
MLLFCIFLLLTILINAWGVKNEVTFLSYDSPSIQNEVAYQDEKHTYCIRPIVSMNIFGLELSDISDGNGADAFSGLIPALDEVRDTFKM